MLKARVLKNLRRPLFLTRLGMIAERITHAFWPLWSLIFTLWALLSFNALAMLSLELNYFFVLAGVAGLVAALIHGFRRFRWPGKNEASQRLDQSLKNRPLTALWDQQAIGADDAGSSHVWRAHMAQMAASAAKAGAVQPNLKISDRDPYGLRYMAATAFVVALLFGSLNRTDITDALNPTGIAAANSGPIFEGWVEPPRYTGLPGIYLNDIAGPDPLHLPKGSKITFRLYSANDTVEFRETVSGRGPQSDNDETPVETEFDFQVEQDGALTLSGADTRKWPIVMIPDTPPLILLTGPVDRTPQGETTFAFKASDDYRVISATATISLNLDAVDRRYGLSLPPEPLEDITLDLPMPFSRDTIDFTETLVEDLSKHPWAGLPVTLTLSATDDLAQAAMAEPENIRLPGRRFFDPLAAALVEQRRDLLWNRLNAIRTAQVLRAVSYLPEDIFDNEKAYLILRTAIRRLEGQVDYELTDDARDEIVDLLWRVALLIEDGDLSDAEARLRRAEERLSEAIENGATDEEIAELTEDLRRAMQDYIEKLAREAEQNPNQNQSARGELPEVTADQLQEMLDRIQELTREGRNEEAQELLDQLRQMMENIETARRQQGEGEGQQSMRELADTMRQQQDLSDDAFRQMQEEFNGNRQPGQNGTQQGDPQDSKPSQNSEGIAQTRRDLASRQQALQKLLEEQRNALPPPNSEAGRRAREALERAEREMGQSGEALREGDLPKALDDQAEALEALRDGLEDLGREIASNQNQNTGRQGDQAGSSDPNSQRDPLGRQSGSVGRIGSEETTIPGDNPFMRSRELLEEIRRRSGEKNRPRIELDYLERLLDRF